MRYLVTLGQGEEEVPNRRTAPYHDFVSTGPDDQKAGAKVFVDLFINRRLLVADTDSQGEVTVSVAHEALLREWQRVKEWLKENREFLRMRDRLDASLKLWLSRGKLKDGLLGPGLPIAKGEKLAADNAQSLNREEIAYINTGISERKRRKRIQEGIRYAVMGAIALLAVVAGFQWFRAERQRDTAAQAFKSEAQVAGQLKQQLRQASWASVNQAERQFQLGEWHEAIALLARAIKFDPTNAVAAERFFHELIVHREKALPAFIASFDHQNLTVDVAFSPDGARILTASWDKTAKLWDLSSGKLLVTYAHQGTVNSAAFSGNGAQIITASSDHSAKLWETVSGKLIRSFGHQDEVNSAAFSPDGTRILTASVDRTAKLWDTASGKLIASFEHQASVYRGAFSPDGTRLLTACKDRAARLWEVASGKLVATFEHKDAVYDAVFSPDGAQILTASWDKTAKLWDAVSDKLVASFEHQGVVVGALFSPDGARILTASWDKTAKLWDAVSGKLLASFGHRESVQSATFSPNGVRVLTASYDRNVKLWEVASGEPVASFTHQDGLYHAAFGPDGARILTASADKTAKLWDAASGKLIASFDHRDGVTSAAFSPDGARALTASADNQDFWITYSFHATRSPVRSAGCGG
jgi:WD40 repeat protein